MAEINKQKENQGNESQKKSPVQENDLIFQTGELLKNPLITGLGGFFFGYWLTSTKYENELKELKEEVRQIGKRKKEKSEGEKKLPDKKKPLRQGNLLQLD